MRKKFLVMAATAAALTMATGITAFAGTWKSDTWGTYYENEDGTRPVYAGWFTDPADGSIYFMDPDGYIMVGTVVEGFKLGDDGRRVEKTEEDLAKEAERKAAIASRPSPAKAAAQATQNAKTGTTAVATTRGSYLAEMTVFMDKVFIATADKRTDTTITPASTKNSTELSYAFANPDGYQFIKASLWKVGKSTAADYHENTAEFVYHYDAVGDPDRDIYTSAFEELIVISAGETEGKNIVDAINTERAAGTTSFNRSGQTDTGNSYTLKYNGNLATLKIVCSEIVAPTADENAEATEGTAAEENAVEEAAATTSVIVAGQSSSSTEADTAEETTAETEETAAVEETAAETVASENTEA